MHWRRQNQAGRRVQRWSLWNLCGCHEGKCCNSPEHQSSKDEIAPWSFPQREDIRQGDDTVELISHISSQMAHYPSSWFSSQPSWLITVDKWQDVSSSEVNILKTVIHFCAGVRSVIKICIIDLIQGFLFFSTRLKRRNPLCASSLYRIWRQLRGMLQTPLNWERWCWWRTLTSMNMAGLLKRR